MQGNCTSMYNGDDLDPLPTVPQCVIRTHQSFLALTDASANLWLSDLYILLVPSAGGASQQAPPTNGVLSGASGAPTVLNVAAADAWVTSSIFVGDGVNTRGINVGPGRRMYARGTLPAPTAACTPECTRQPSRLLPLPASSPPTAQSFTSCLHLLPPLALNTASTREYHTPTMRPRSSKYSPCTHRPCPPRPLKLA